MHCRHAFPAGIVAACLAGCGPDQGQAALCERVLWAVIDAAEPGRTRLGETPPDQAHVVTLAYEGVGRDGGRITGQVRCRFAGGGFGTERFKLLGIWTDDAGELSPFSVAHVKNRLGLD